MTTGPTFGEGVEAQHHRVDADEWENIYVVGDVHGCRTELVSLVERLAPGDDELLVFVGDLVRKGPDSQGVVELVRESDNMLSVRGNNEEKLIRGDKHLPELTPEDEEFIHDMPVAISWEGALVVHGGVDPREPLADHSVDDLQNTRSLDPDGSYDRPFWFEEYDERPRVFFGHTVMEDPVVREHAVGLDTGCVYGGELTAYDTDADRFVTVPAVETVEERSDSKIVTPANS